MIDTPPLVVAVAYDRLCTFEFGIAVEVFALPRPEIGAPPYRFAVAAAEAGPLRAVGAISIIAEGGLDLLDEAHTIVMPGWRDVDEPPPAPLLAALQAAARRGARLVSLCSGVFPLAHAGLLDGRKATTHWRYAERLAARFPAIRVVPGALYVDEGDVLTAAGSAAGIDLLLHLVRKDHGAKIANLVARRLVVPAHRDGDQAQFILQPVAVHRSDRIAEIVAFMTERLQEPLTVERLAGRAAMSLRSFTRRFRAATGASPIEFLIRLRVRHAQDLLAATGLSIDSVASEAGFGSPEALRHHFRRVAKTSPTAWRRVFGERRDAPAAQAEPART